MPSNLPIRLFHGDQDPIVSVESSRAWQRRLQDAGVSADYIEYPGVRHNAWDLAYRNGAIFDWFDKFRRNRFPDRVRFVTSSYRYSSAYWVRIDGLTPGLTASIDAAWTAPNALTRPDPESRWLHPHRRAPHHTAPRRRHHRWRSRPREARRIPRLHESRPAAGNPAASILPAKRPGAEGPISEAVSARQIYVYGSTGTQTADELDARRALAERAAAWSTARSRLSLSLPVKADSDITDADLDSSDLILFGTPETNSVIARFAATLPLALSPAAPDYGLLFIAPIGKHYALVSSGLPWWTGADEANRRATSLAPEQFRQLSSFGDYILFKGSLENVVAEGRFDRNWKIPADAAAQTASARHRYRPLK